MFANNLVTWLLQHRWLSGSQLNHLLKSCYKPTFNVFVLSSSTVYHLKATCSDRKIIPEQSAFGGYWDDMLFWRLYIIISVIIYQKKYLCCHTVVWLSFQKKRQISCVIQNMSVEEMQGDNNYTICIQIYSGKFCTQNCWKH